jgi:hypothetical protein
VVHANLNIRPARKPTGPSAGPREFADQLLSGRVLLDNTTFRRCKFQEAVLVYSGGAPPHIHDCAFDSVTFEFEDAAGRTLAFLQSMAHPRSGLSEIIKNAFAKLFGH